jgi:hypothetical protein
MRLNMIRMRMADENSIRSGLWFVCIQPQAQLREMQTASLKFNSQNGHGRKINPKSEIRNPKECLSRQASRLP